MKNVDVQCLYCWLKDDVKYGMQMCCQPEGVFAHNHHSGCCSSGTLSTTTLFLFLFTHDCSCSSWILTSKIVPLIYWCDVLSGDKTLWILVESLFKSNFLPCFWPWSSLLVSHRNYRQKRAKEIYYNHHEYSQLHIVSYFAINSSCGCHQC